MGRRLTEKRGGGKRRKEKMVTWNEGVEEVGSFKKTIRYCISPAPCRTVSSDLLKTHSDLQFSRFEANPTPLGHCNICSDRTRHIQRIMLKDFSKRLVRLASYLPSWLR